MTASVYILAEHRRRPRMVSVCTGTGGWTADADVWLSPACIGAELPRQGALW